jgi:hypothetical protein
MDIVHMIFYIAGSASGPDRGPDIIPESGSGSRLDWNHVVKTKILKM